MLFSLLPFVVAVAISLPVISSSLLPRSDVCANDGKTKVGTLFHGRELSPSTIHSRAIPQIPCFWCLPRTQTAVSINFFDHNFWTSANSPVLLGFLNQVLNEVRQHLYNSDGPIPNGQFLFRKYGLSWFVMNENNHQMTWGVMGAAIEALTNFMVLYGFGPTYFTVTDGTNIVGRGLFQPDP